MLAAVALLGAVVLARVVLYQGLLAPVRVISGSMAPTLVGEHFHLLCADCGYEFRCDRSAPPLEMQAVCPNCGYDKIPVDADVWQPGERVLIDQLATIRTPRRWEIVAFALPEQPQELAVKRVVGLPGERVAIRDGDVYIDGRIVRKNLREQRQTAVLVHDNDHRPGRQTSALPPRWQPDAAKSKWESKEGSFTFATNDVQPDDPAALDWLTYRHTRHFVYPQPRSEEAPIRDSYAYNQVFTRQLNFATDLMFVCRLNVAGSGQLVLRFDNGREVVEAVIEPAAERLLLRIDGSERAAVAWPKQFSGRNVELVFSVIDRRALLAVEGGALLEQPYDRADRPLTPTSRPLAVGARQVNIELDHLRIYRDLHYLAPHGFVEPWESPALADDELFVLGDNVPVSRDSRAWRESLKCDALVGSVTHP